MPLRYRVNKTTDSAPETLILEVTTVKGLAALEKYLRNMPEESYAYDVIIFRGVLPQNCKENRRSIRRLCKKYGNLFHHERTRKSLVSGVWIKSEEVPIKQTPESLYDLLDNMGSVAIFDIKDQAELASAHDQCIKKIGTGLVNPMYGMNLQLNETCYLNNIPFLITPEQNNKISPEDPMIGINRPTKYIGSPFSYTPFHWEDGGCDSVNIVTEGLEPDAKLWMFIRNADNDSIQKKYTQDTRTMIRRGDFPDESILPGCSWPDCHKIFLRTHEYVFKTKARTEFLVQQVGDVVYVAPHVLHQVINLSTNYAEAVNVGSSRWLETNIYGRVQLYYKETYTCREDGCGNKYHTAEALRNHLLHHTWSNLEQAKLRYPDLDNLLPDPKPALFGEIRESSNYCQKLMGSPSHSELQEKSSSHSPDAVSHYPDLNNQNTSLVQPSERSTSDPGLIPSPSDPAGVGLSKIDGIMEEADREIGVVHTIASQPHLGPVTTVYVPTENHVSTNQGKYVIKGPAVAPPSSRFPYSKPGCPRCGYAGEQLNRHLRKCKDLTCPKCKKVQSKYSYTRHVSTCGKDPDIQRLLENNARLAAEFASEKFTTQQKQTKDNLSGE
ncbi:hypothetical protein QAD02_007442 [Eretmocerus hayati]|uniref:Uncharacterized protein n=1 Tax=Eretmocerus hayati TaxID=131215 RepID=A0ACC2N3M7_9HYME|nr:hypothetical protein QAD02_007442 [Eretmocerus hayati]